MFDWPQNKGFCSIIKFSFDFDRKHSNLDFETEFVQVRSRVRYEVIEMLQFQNWQVDFNFQNFAFFLGGGGSYWFSQCVYTEWYTAMKNCLYLGQFVSDLSKHGFKI